ncbi:hypothetical protein LXL04_018847 [Taraxacum kok-saghyz]
MDSLNAILDMSKEELEAFLNDPNSDTTNVRGLVKLLSEIIHTFILTAIIKITQKGYTDEEAKHAILRCGPFHSTEGNQLESNFVERALISLESNKKDDDSSNYAFQDINELVDFMILEMVTTVRDMKPAVTSPISVTEAVWSLLMCDLDVRQASSQSESKNKKALASDCEIRAHLKMKTCSQNSKSGKETEDACDCECKKWCAMATSKRDAALRQKVVQIFEKKYKGRGKGMKKKFSSLKDLCLDDKQSPSSSSEQNKNIRLRLKVIEEKQVKIEDHHQYLPRDEEDIGRLESVAQLQSLRKELHSWDDWANSKVMQVTQRLGQNRVEVKKLKLENEKAIKDYEDTEGNVTKRLVEMTLSLNRNNTELNVATSAIVKLKSEQTVVKAEMERERDRSLLEGKRLEEALIKEEEALKKSKSFGSERNGLEEELKGLRREVGQKQRELKNAKCLLTESEIRVAKEEKEIAKVVSEAESIKKERESVEALAIAEYEITKYKAEEELKKNETEKKMIEYEISALKLEYENKQIVAMKKSMDMNNINKKKKKNYRECLMCFNEEMAVVFVPCGHRVLCKECNLKHEERMIECPSCRTLIQKRIDVQSAKA